MEIDLTKGPEHAAKIKFMVILLAIVFIIVIALIIFIGVREPEEEPETQERFGEMDDEIQETVEEPETQETQETQETELTQAQVEQIKLDIVRGKTDEVPEELDSTKRQIVKEYLASCHDMPYAQEKYDCFELYYTNNDDSLMQKKNECEMLSGQEKTDCFDKYYYALAFEVDVFCDLIKDEGLKNQCFTEYI